MRDWTEQEEQEMIQRAKAGDPEANYELSQWARQRAEEEPEEPRWNRLAAKCLLKAAQAGYGPAQEQMEELLIPKQQLPQEEPEVRQAPAKKTAERASRGQQTRAARGPRPVPPPPAADDADEPAEGYDYEDEYDDQSGRSAPAARREKGSMNPFQRLNDMFAGWGDAQWKRMQIVCVVICVVLAVLIVAMIVTRPRGGASPEEEPPVPTAEAVEPQALPTAAPEETYPGQDIIDRIEAAELDVNPDPEDYVTGPTTAVVSVGNILRLREGPSTAFEPPVAEMPNGARVEVYAQKDNWALVLYNGDTWGWCSKDYLIEDASPVTPTPDAPEDAPEDIPEVEE